MAMKLKTVEVGGKTYAEVSTEGRPIFIDDDGKETGIDVPLAMETLAKRNGEVQGYRRDKEAAETKLKAFDGLDPEKARKAIELVANIDESKLLAADKVEELKTSIRRAAEEQLAQATKAAETKIGELTATLEKTTGQLHAETIGNAFSRSKFISEKVAIPVDMVQTYFGKNFKLEDGKIVAYDNNGNKIYSRAAMGTELASFDEAIEMLVDKYQFKDTILKGTGGGSGAKGGSGGGAAGTKTMSRTDFDKLPAAERMAKFKEGVAVTPD